MENKLREKFETKSSIDTSKEARAFAIHCEQLANYHTEQFGEWFVDNSLRVDLDGYKVFGDTDKSPLHTLKQLVEIFNRDYYGK